MDEGLNFVSCLAWIKRGVAKPTPDVVTLDKEELKELLKAEKANPGNAESGDDGEVEPENDGSDNSLDMYNMDDYDEEDEENNAMSFAGLTYYNCNDEDPNITVKDEDDDSDEEDLNIKPTDNLIAVGHGKKDASVLEIHIYNEDDDDLYVHHDISLSFMPLCVEWLDFDSADANKNGNFLAVGGMCPQIEIWDVDVVNCLEPEFSLLRSKKSKVKKKIPKMEMVVLGLSWNKLVRSVLASSYNDCTVAVWDMAIGKDVTSLAGFEDKVQSLVWHPFEGETLLTGSSDKSVKIFDCRVPGKSIKSWECDGEVESVIWNHFDPYQCLAATDKGNVYCYDARLDNHIWKLDAHSDSCTGLSLSGKCPGFLVTVSTEKQMKIWDILDNKPSLVLQRTPNVGEIYCAAVSPDSPFTVALGGKHKSKPFKIMNTISNSSVSGKFGARKLMERSLTNESDLSGASTSCPENSNKEVKGETECVKKRKVKTNETENSEIKLKKKSKERKARTEERMRRKSKTKLKMRDEKLE